MWPKSQDWNSQKHRRNKLGKHFFFQTFALTNLLEKITHGLHTAEYTEERRRVLEHGKLSFHQIHHSSRETGPSWQLRMKVSAVRSQSAHCCCVTGICPVHPRFLYGSAKHRASNQFPNFKQPFAHRSRRWIAVDRLHAGCIDAVASSPAVTTGWQCWRGSAEPTTHPDLWAQSLRHNKNIELTMKFM